MTGYGKAETTLGGGKLTVEVKSLNGKTADISIKSSLLPKDKELEIRKLITEALGRGNIDLYLTHERGACEETHTIDKDVVASYLSQLTDIADKLNLSPSKEMLLDTLLHFPDVVSTPKTDIINDENWPAVRDCIMSAVAALADFRSKEGAVLYKDVTAKVAAILANVDEVEKYEGERIATVRTRIQAKFAELSIEPDPDKLVSEMIYYIEKFDINEEKTRLRQHCRYFMDTIDTEPNPGKKLGFIAQEMGREINTLGSKANHAEIQKIVVHMKDDLEKIKEQSLNIL